MSDKKENRFTVFPINTSNGIRTIKYDSLKDHFIDEDRDYTSLDSKIRKDVEGILNNNMDVDWVWDGKDENRVEVFNKSNAVNDVCTLISELIKP